MDFGAGVFWERKVSGFVGAWVHGGGGSGYDNVITWELGGEVDEVREWAPGVGVG